VLACVLNLISISSMLKGEINVGNFVDLALEDIVELLSSCHVSICIKKRCYYK
jgi:hypothetical protein